VVLANPPMEEHRDASEIMESLAQLLHIAWLRWPTVKHTIYSFLGVKNTEELIQRIVDVRECRVRSSWLTRFYEALRRVVPDAKEAQRQLEKLAAEGVWVTPFTSKFYPCELLRYPAHGDYLYPPLMLYRLGVHLNPNEKPAVAVVGTRKCSGEGRRLAREVGRILARHGLILVTGLAECIDAEAAQGAVEEGGIVIGVRPWLKPLSLPQESKRLLSHIHNNLIIVSENPYKTSRGSIKRLYFLRNRIIAGMAKLVIVVEARPDGGSMHQIELALKRGKPVAVYEPPPGTPYHEAYRQYRGKGAKPFKTLKELVDSLQAIIA